MPAGESILRPEEAISAPSLNSAPPLKRARIASSLDTHVTNVISSQRHTESGEPLLPTRNGNCSSNGMESALPGAIFDMSALIEQPLVFDFNTSPYHGTIQTSKRVDSDHVRPIHGNSPRDLGNGTLVISKSGASSKYYGHTAGSEWLQDVRHRCLAPGADETARNQRGG
jgi:hypothetical protein